MRRTPLAQRLPDHHALDDVCPNARAGPERHLRLHAYPAGCGEQRGEVHRSQLIKHMRILELQKQGEALLFRVR